MIRPALLTLALFGLAACDMHEAPYLYVDPKVTVTKPIDTLHIFGQAWICYDDHDLDAARGLAAQTCQKYDLHAMQIRIERYTCSSSAPHRLRFICYDPQMRFSNGAWINPLNAQQVRFWRKEQARLTGKPLSEIYAGPSRQVPGLGDDEDDRIPIPEVGRDDYDRPTVFEGGGTR